jgi:hypothetical protein
MADDVLTPKLSEATISSDQASAARDTAKAQLPHSCSQPHALRPVIEDTNALC